VVGPLSSAPRRIPHKTPPDRVSAICELRQLRVTAAEISTKLRMPLSTVSAVLLREGLGKRSRLAAPEPICRYERSSPGELIHVDVKKLGRFEGGPAVHVAIDDYSRLAYVEVLPDEKAQTSIDFLERALAFFAGYGITVQRVMTDNGAPSASARSRPSSRTTSSSTWRAAAPWSPATR
jgi:hypothetical protein